MSKLRVPQGLKPSVVFNSSGTAEAVPFQSHMDAKLQRWRDETPGCAHVIHLNNAGASLMPQPVLQAIVEHLNREAERGAYEAADAAAEQDIAARRSVAELIGAHSRNLAVVENATVAFAQALAAFDFAPGDVIVTTRNDYISNQLMYLSMGKRLGVEIARAADLPEGGVDPQSVRELARNPKCKLVAVTWVPTNSGLVQPVEAVGEVCDEIGVPYLVDACQAVGQIPINVSRLRCDFLSATARKFMRGPRGIGFLYVSDRVLQRGMYPLLVDMRGAKWLGANEFEVAPDASRFENWEFAYALILGMGAAARYAATVGIDEAQRRARRLASYTREKLSAVPGIRVLDRGPELCALVTVEVRSKHSGPLVTELRKRNINCSSSPREYAVIDMDEKHATSALRISPHYYNTIEEVDALISAVEEITLQPAHA